MNNSFDIVAFINNNPLSRLPSGTTSLLVNKIKERFTAEEQQLYIANLYAYLNYNDTDFVVPLNNVWKWLGFTRCDNTIRLLKKEFKENTDYKIYGNKTTGPAPPTGGAAFSIDEEKNATTDYKTFEKNDGNNTTGPFPPTGGKPNIEINGNNSTNSFPQVGGKPNIEINGIDSTNGFPPIGGKPNIEIKGNNEDNESVESSVDEEKKYVKNKGGAGLNKEYIYMTVNCFKKLCLKAKTSKADEIHDYYIKMERVVNETVCEQANEFSKQLQIKEEEIKNVDRHREQNLLLNYSNKRVLYLIYIKELDMCKFGISDNIEQRFKDHKRVMNNYTISLSYVIETGYNDKLENTIKENCKKKEHILYNRQREYSFKLGANYTELIQLDEIFTVDRFYKTIMDRKTNEEIIAELSGKIKELEQLNEEKDKKIEELMSIIKKSSSDEIIIKDKEIELQKIRLETIKNISFTPQPESLHKYLLYQPHTLEFIESFDSIHALCNKHINMIKKSIERAIRNNMEYKGYRIWRVDKNAEGIPEIPPTKKSDRKPKLEQVVQVSMDRTKIINVYSSPVNAAELFTKSINKEENIKQIKKSITNNLTEDENRSTYGYKWYYISEVPEEIKNQLVQFNIPEVTFSKKMKKVYKYDSNRNLITTYKSLIEATETEKISDTTLRRCSNNDEIYNNHYWEIESN
jgi:hypothetical protein